MFLLGTKKASGKFVRESCTKITPVHSTIMPLRPRLQSVIQRIHEPWRANKASKSRRGHTHSVPASTHPRIHATDASTHASSSARQRSRTNSSRIDDMAARLSSPRAEHNEDLDLAISSFYGHGHAAAAAAVVMMLSRETPRAAAAAMQQRRAAAPCSRHMPTHRKPKEARASQPVKPIAAEVAGDNAHAEADDNSARQRDAAGARCKVEVSAGRNNVCLRACQQQLTCDGGACSRVQEGMGTACARGARAGTLQLNVMLQSRAC